MRPVWALSRWSQPTEVVVQQYQPQGHTGTEELLLCEEVHYGLGSVQTPTWHLLYHADFAQTVSHMSGYFYGFICWPHRVTFWSRMLWGMRSSSDLWRVSWLFGVNRISCLQFGAFSFKPVQYILCVLLPNVEICFKSCNIQSHCNKLLKKPLSLL